MAILVTALAAVVAVAALSATDRWLERVDLGRDKGQTAELARAGRDRARLLLAVDARRSAVDTLDETWAQPAPPWQSDGVAVTVAVEDLQGRFNLNNLRREEGVVDERAYAAYERLLDLLGLPHRLADTLADWLDADASPRAEGVERSDDPALPSATNRALDHSGDLSRVAGYTPEVLARLAPFVCVLEGEQPVNVNTAPPEVLAAIQPGLSLAAAQALVQARRSVHFINDADFRNRLPPRLPDSRVPLVAASSHFLIRVGAAGPRSRVRLQAQVLRDFRNGETRIQWQSLQ